EVVDALPAHHLVVDGDEFRERFVTWDEAAAWFGTTLGPLSAEVGDSRVVNALGSQGVVPGALPDGAILEVSPRAAGWIREVAQGIERGYALIVDYGYPAAELYRGHRLGGLLRGYREHTVTDDPFTAIGEQDLTTHVDFSWLASAARGAGMHEIGLTTQADFLAALGLGDLLVTFQHDGETSIDEYYQAQAAVLRLIDPGGMGRFRVLGLSKGVTNADGVHPVRGFVAPALDYPEF
ncbi:MAG TPA: SAM-dependent methyltransferase, partial [Thermomicrobiales bacterium]|nr:SAM-dependent methyltransferase [Thermomicrobiales bacterium]